MYNENNIKNNKTNYTRKEHIQIALFLGKKILSKLMFSYKFIIKEKFVLHNFGLNIVLHTTQFHDSLLHSQFFGNKYIHNLFD